MDQLVARTPSAEVVQEWVDRARDLEPVVAH